MKQLIRLNGFWFYVVFIGVPIIILSISKVFTLSVKEEFVFTFTIPLLYILTFVFLWLIMAVRVVTDCPLPWYHLKKGAHMYAVCYLGVGILTILLFLIVSIDGHSSCYNHIV